MPHRPPVDSSTWLAHSLDEQRRVDGDTDRPAGTGALRRLGRVPRFDRLDTGGLVGGREQQRVAELQLAALDPPRRIRRWSTL